MRFTVVIATRTQMRKRRDNTIIVEIDKKIKMSFEIKSSIGDDTNFALR